MAVTSQNTFKYSKQAHKKELGNFENKIIILDDDQDDIEVLENFFKKMGQEENLLSFNNSNTFLNKISENHEMWDTHDTFNLPRLLILDIHMPNHTGLEILTKIKNYQEWDGVPIVLITGTQNDKDIQKAYDLGATAFIAKPFNFVELVQTIHRSFNATTSF